MKPQSTHTLELRAIETTVRVHGMQFQVLRPVLVPIKDGRETTTTFPTPLIRDRHNWDEDTKEKHLKTIKPATCFAFM